MVNRIAHLLSPGFDMPRRSHPKSQLATTISPALHECVRDFSDATNMPISQVVEDALRAYLRSMYWQTDENLEDDNTRGGANG